MSAPALQQSTGYSNICWGCLIQPEKPENLLDCNCDVAKYCNQKCQKADASHLYLCQALQQARKPDPEEWAKLKDAFKKQEKPVGLISFCRNMEASPTYLKCFAAMIRALHDCKESLKDKEPIEILFKQLKFKGDILPTNVGLEAILNFLDRNQIGFCQLPSSYGFLPTYIHSKKFPVLAIEGSPSNFEKIFKLQQENQNQVEKKFPDNLMFKETMMVDSFDDGLDKIKKAAPKMALYLKTIQNLKENLEQLVSYIKGEGKFIILVATQDKSLLETEIEKNFEPIDIKSLFDAEGGDFDDVLALDSEFAPCRLVFYKKR